MLEVRSPMVGRVVRVLVEPGAAVQAEDELLVLESMKMEIPVEAPRPGTVREVRVQVGDLVQENTVLLVLA
ncbi:MAG TPA: acetyl-CoA carboxylase biotin carboxyl carrier protein subunit [Dehalococcoidia bacterium]